MYPSVEAWAHRSAALVGEGVAASVVPDKQVVQQGYGLQLACLLEAGGDVPARREPAGDEAEADRQVAGKRPVGGHCCPHAVPWATSAAVLDWLERHGL